MRSYNIGCFPILCAIVGAIVSGPIGAIFGYFIGGFVSKASQKTGAINDQVLYHISALFAAVMKADNSIMRSELYSFRDFFLQRFGSEAANKALDHLKKLKDTPINLQEHAGKLNLKLNYTERMEILRYLFQLSYADGNISQPELDVIREISQYFQIRQQDFLYLYNAYNFTYSYQQSYSGQNSYNGNYQGGYQGSYGTGDRSNSLEKDYALLGVKSTDSDDTIKKAYRRLAIDNHPDKVAHLGETARKEAEKRFAQINEAFQRIKAARGMS